MFPHLEVAVKDIPWGKKQILKKTLLIAWLRQASTFFTEIFYGQ